MRWSAVVGLGLSGCQFEATARLDAAPPSVDAAPVTLDAAPARCGELVAVIRDFRADHPDFEDAVADDRNLVAGDLGGDGKPVYAPSGATTTVSGRGSFDQWYRDVPGVNLRFERPLVLAGSGGRVEFASASFFPLDGVGWPLQEVAGHNYHFTTEIHAAFTYRGGDQLTFDGDDDVWAFVNRRLALDLGGVHGAETASIDFDADAARFGISIGSTYQLDVFHAERHTSESNFRLSTTIDCPVARP